uniref:AC5 n=1 Tax=Chilli leaf curl virus TaxID=172278 RepID=A0A5J6AC20_9GEMI|nr:AC5 [Chilli leaf curl virus]UVY90112.1 C5 protein [Chilli leaf curl virus]
MCSISCLDSNDWTLHGPSHPLGTSVLLYILYLLGFRSMGLLVHALAFVTRTMGTAARLAYGLPKFRRRRTFEPGVEMIISAGRFDIIPGPNN